MAHIADTAAVVIFIGVLVVLSAIDVRRRIVPNRIVLPAAAVVLVLRTIAHPSVVWLVAGLGASLFLLVAAVVKPDGMGMGDVKLALLLGFAVGRSVPIALLVALLAAAVPSLALLVRHGAAGRTIGIPFAPFLAVGGICGLVVGGGFGS